MKKVLLLNASYEPLKVLTWKKAVLMYFSDKVNVLESYDDFTLRSAGGFTMPCPAVVALCEYVNVQNARVTFSRTNVFSRDFYTCQYCGAQPGYSGLTYDHVLPKSRGGKTSWTNIVTACYDCNGKKSNRTPEEANMKLRKEPIKPRTFAELAKTFRTKDSPEIWDPYLPE